MNGKGQGLNIRKTDIILILVLLAGGIFFLLRTRMSPGGDTVVIRVDNEAIASFPLKENRTYTVSNELGTNTIVIEDGMAYVTCADCPDRICESMGKISKPGEVIVCLPHRLIVEVTDEE